VGTLFGVATSLGFGAIQINAGLSYVAGIDSSRIVQLILIIVITAVATGSVLLGLNAGIKRLSEINISLMTLLSLFILIAGPTVFILRALVESTGYYLQNIIATSMRTDMFTDPGWQGDWTIFYWGWWISWSPFVGMFIARISRGRTVREFITGVLLVPTVITFAILSIFGQTALNIELFGVGGITEATADSVQFALFAMLEHLPIPLVTSIIAIIVIATFFVTSSDSGSLVHDTLASGGSIEHTWETRVFWAVSEGAVAAILLFAGGATGLAAFQQASITTGVPLAILMLVICYALFVALRQDHAETMAATRRRGVPEPRPAPAAARPPSGVSDDANSSGK
jgi:choline/glycine/proline betaine transport protein